MLDYINNTYIIGLRLDNFILFIGIAVPCLWLTYEEIANHFVKRGGLSHDKPTVDKQAPDNQDSSG